MYQIGNDQLDLHQESKVLYSPYADFRSINLRIFGNEAISI
jgi:hypothetical protein